MRYTAIIGGGISGLAAAWRLRAHGTDVTLFEAAGCTGGVIRSVRRDGFLVDEGPNTLVARHTVVEETIAALGLEDARVWADGAARRRFVVKDGEPLALPASPGAFLRSPLLSAGAKLRLLREPFVRRGEGEDESLAGFVRRRLGPEVLDQAVSPFVAGVFAGAPERLSTRHAFPMLYALEREHGSLVRGMIRRARAARSSDAPGPSSRPFSFREGMQTLPDALADRLGDAIRTNEPVTGLRRDAEGWAVTTQRDGATQEHRFDAVLSTVPLHRLGTLGLDADLSIFDEVLHPPVSVLALGFERAQVGHALDGFGVLVPEREPFRLLGALFSSTLFPGRAPEGHVLLTCFTGGMRHPEDAALPTDDLVALARADLERLLGVRGEPAFVHRARWEHAIPQYHVGYGRVLAALDALEARHPGLVFAGNYRQGISVGEALRSGLDAADRLLEAER